MIPCPKPTVVLLHPWPLNLWTVKKKKKKILLQTGKVILSLLKSVWNSVSGSGVTSDCAWGCRRWRKDKEIGKDTSRVAEGWFQVLGKVPWLPAPGNLARDVRARTCSPGQEGAWRLGQLSQYHLGTSVPLQERSSWWPVFLVLLEVTECLTKQVHFPASSARSRVTRVCHEISGSSMWV